MLTTNKILVVDDEKETRDFFKRYGEVKGFKVTTCESGLLAIEKVKENGFDIIFMDIVMPEMNGVDTFREMKSFLKSGIKVIMMTGYAVIDLVKEAMEEGAYKCIQKPFDINEIEQIITGITKANDKKS